VLFLSNGIAHFDAPTGDQDWQYTSAGSLQPDSAIGSNNVIYVAELDSSVPASYLDSISQSTGQLINQIQLPTGSSWRYNIDCFQGFDIGGNLAAGTGPVLVAPDGSVFLEVETSQYSDTYVCDGPNEYQAFTWNDTLSLLKVSPDGSTQYQTLNTYSQLNPDDSKPYSQIDLTIEKKVQESLGTVRDKARLEGEEGLKLKVLEKEELIASMQRQIEELKHRAEQGSQQLQGEVQELELESLLRAKFPHDMVEPVAKGEFGGDVLHRVVGAQGQHCGTILWESKRTKNWSDAWLAKLRDDQRAAKADVALIVSAALPKGIKNFDFVDGIWVTESRCAMSVAIALRQTLIELSAARQASEGQQSKMEMVYQYLTGPRFRHRVEAIVEKFSDMQADLDRERKAMTRGWAKSEEQIRAVIGSTAGMYGDLQGIAGRPLQEIEGLEMPLLEAAKTEVEDES